MSEFENFDGRFEKFTDAEMIDLLREEAVYNHRHRIGLADHLDAAHVEIVGHRWLLGFLAVLVVILYWT